MTQPRFTRSLTFKMTLLVLGGTVLVFLIILGDTYLSSREIILTQAEANARNLADSMARRIEQEFRAIAKVPENFASFLETDDWDQAGLLRLLAELVKRNPEVYGSVAAFEPYALNKDLEYFAPYFYRRPSGLGFKQLGNETYNYFQWEWYQMPRELRTPVWTEPYVDEGGGGIIMCTYAVPFMERRTAYEQTKLKGVITADISLDWLNDVMGSIRTLQSGYGFLISRNGTFITHPQRELVMKESIFSVAEEQGEPQLRELGRRMIRSDAGFVVLDSALTDGPAFLAFTRIPSTGWSLGVVFSRDELLAELNDLNQRAGFLAWVGLLLLFLVVLLIARSITGPLRKMAQATAKVAGGDLDIDLSDIKSGSEIGQLAESFTHMSRDLKKYIQDLTETTAVKERIESELNIAAQIQKSILPSTFPPFPEHQEFALHALMEPAREVGGDFYDFFLLDDDRLALIIADVSGKGVPAALFMMVGRTLLKSIARQGKSPAAVLAEANNLLCQGNDAAMFVTVFLAYYDIRTGNLTYANAGHHPALVTDRHGAWREFGRMGGVALGYMPDLSYKEGADRLQPGETLILFTDGVTEALSPGGLMFGADGLRRFMDEEHDRKLSEICERLRRTLAEFQQDQQFDDITMMLLRREG